MPTIDPRRNEIHFKVVYDGVGLAGKTTNLQYVHARTDPARRGRMVARDGITPETPRTLSFSFRPVSLAPVDGRTVVLDLWTVPGAVFDHPSRRTILDAVDGLVHVVDSLAIRRDSNVEAIANLCANLESFGRRPAAVPLVLQYNKRDLPDVDTVEDLQRALNPWAVPHIEASAHTGVGVFDTLRACAHLVPELASARAAGAAR